MVELHTCFIEKMRDKSFLNQKARLIYNCIQRGLLVAIEFRDYCMMIDEAEMKVSLACVASSSIPTRKGLAKLQSEPNLRSMMSLTQFKSSALQNNSGSLSRNHALDDEIVERFMDFQKRFMDLKRFLICTYEELAGRAGLEHC